jgi:hypothetical protein
MMPACRRPARPAARVATDAGRPGVDGERIWVPVTSGSQGAAAVPGMFVNVPIQWVFLREEPVPTGAAPHAVIGAELPCGYRPLMAVEESQGTERRIRLRAGYVGPGRPRDAGAPCVAPAAFIDFVSLEKVRLGNYIVTDALPRRPGEPAAPRAALRVVSDGPQTPGPMAQRVRPCSPGHDESCTAGGVCGAVPGQSVGTCVPALDPYLSAGLPCPHGSLSAALEHASAYAVRPAPRAGPLLACLQTCTGGAAEREPQLRCVSLPSGQVYWPSSALGPER